MSLCTSQEPLESSLLSFPLSFGTCMLSLDTPRGQQTLGEAGLRAGYVPVGIFQDLGIIFMRRDEFCISFLSIFSTDLKQKGKTWLLIRI